MKKPRPSSDIPAARERLLAIAQKLPDRVAAEIRGVVHDLMFRVHTNTPRARARRGCLNPKLAAEIRAYKEANPGASQDEIGRHFNVAGGRVSEALAGHDWSPNRTGQRK